MLAVQADRCKITTIEGMANNGELHPLQEGFNQCHGLQCGFCTPGMIMTAADLLQNNRKPSEEEIRTALEGNFCRCTGYHNIVKSVQYAAEKMSARKTKPKRRPIMSTNNGKDTSSGFIGKSVKRVEDKRFTTGNGRYTDDIVLPHQTYASFVRSPYAHAKILSVDTSAAKSMPV